MNKKKLILLTIFLLSFGIVNASKYSTATQLWELGKNFILYEGVNEKYEKKLDIDKIIYKGNNINWEYIEGKYSKYKTATTELEKNGDFIKYKIPTGVFIKQGNKITYKTPGSMLEIENGKINYITPTTKKSIDGKNFEYITPTTK